MDVVETIERINLIALYILPVVIIVAFSFGIINTKYIITYLSLLLLGIIFAMFSETAKQHFTVSIGVAIISVVIFLTVITLFRYILPNYKAVKNGNLHYILILVPTTTALVGLLWGTVPPFVRGYMRSIYSAIRLKNFTYNPISVTLYKGLITMFFILGLTVVILVYITPLWLLIKTAYTILKVF